MQQWATFVVNEIVLILFDTTIELLCDTYLY